MTAPIDKERRKLLRKAFRMPLLQTTVSRISSITNAFVGSIMPVFRPTDEDIEIALKLLQIDPSNLRCAYCGDEWSEWDHLNPLVMNRRPTGYISEIANLVPACGKCNQSKRNESWQTWMLSKVDRSPTGRGLLDVAARVERLSEYEKWRSARKVDFESIVGQKEWEEYWALCEEVVIKLRQCKIVADDRR